MIPLACLDLAGRDKHTRGRDALGLLVLLHQDERALDLVRATDARLLRLGWHRAVPGWLRELRLRAEPARFPLPVMLLESEDTDINRSAAPVVH